MRGEDGETRASRFVLVRCAQGPEGDRATTKLREPALQFRLGGVVRQAAHVEDLAALREERANICAGIHWLGENVGVLGGRLRLADEATENACECNRLFHSAAG